MSISNDLDEVSLCIVVCLNCKINSPEDWIVGRYETIGKPKVT